MRNTFVVLIALMAGCGPLPTSPQQNGAPVALTSPVHLANTAFTSGTIAHQDSFLYASSRPSSGVVTTSVSFTPAAGVTAFTRLRAQLYGDLSGLSGGADRILDVYLVRGLSGDTVFTVISSVSVDAAIAGSGWHIQADSSFTYPINPSASYSILAVLRDGHNGTGASLSLRFAWAEVGYTPTSAAPPVASVATIRPERILRIRGNDVLID